MAPRVITFVGNCQANALSRLYREFCVTDADADVAHIDILTLNEAHPGHTGTLRRLSQTGLLVQQVFDWLRPLDGLVPATVERFAFPTASLWFLWPYASEKHPRNDELAPINGPFPIERGDAFLNRQIDAGATPEMALSRYLTRDIVKTASVASRYEKQMDLLDQRDEQTQFGLRDEIEANFRDEQLFRTRGHPNLRIFSLLARKLFQRMGADPAQIEACLASQHRSPFPQAELPIHPQIAAYFNLAYAGPDRLYNNFPERSITFTEYVDLYMRFSVNESIRTLMNRHDLPPERRLEVAERALIQMPDSAFLLAQRAHLLVRLGARDAALDAAWAACKADPEDPAIWQLLAEIFLSQRREADAERAARRALMCHPYDAGAHKLLGQLALRANQITAALPHLRAAALYAPRDADAQTLYATTMHHLGNVPS